LGTIFRLFEVLAQPNSIAIASILDTTGEECPVSRMIAAASMIETK
jgi:hypothetical protein